MGLAISAGKGGVGKTFVSTSLAVFLASTNQKTAIIDYDGGHSVKNTLGHNGEIRPNKIVQVKDNLSVVVIDNKKYKNITEAKDEGWNLDKYLSQFPDDFGIIPFADMVTQFFGVPTDTPALDKFATLVSSIIALQKDDVKNIIVDVEPTAGLERLLVNAESMTRSLGRLKNKGILFLTAVGAGWPEIKGYLKSDYIKNIDTYVQNIHTTVDAIKQACFLLVCTPEFTPGEQTFEVSKIIRNFGGTPRACVVNNMRG